MSQTVFTVEGAGEFPFDMLRFDECYPANSEAVAGIAEPLKRRRVKLISAKRFAPTIGRWDSFNWRVLDNDPNL